METYQVLLEDKLPEHLMVSHKFMHWIIYATLINFFIPVLGIPICLSDNYRKRWVLGYVRGIVERDE